MSKQSKGRILYLSRLKALACIAVVVLHTFYAADAFAKDKTQHMLMLSVRNCCMWAVPCFVMATGALLLDPERKLSYKKLFGRLVLKMALALAVFTFLFELFDEKLIKKEVTGALFVNTWDNIILGTGWKHMWYLYLMIALYLMMPVYKAVTEKRDKNLVCYLCVILFVFLSMRPLVETVTGSQTAFYICVYSVYPLFLFCGYMLHNKYFTLPAWYYAFTASVGLAFTVYFTAACIDTKSKEVTSLLGSYSCPIYVVTAFCIFGAFSGCKGDKRIPILDTIACEFERCSFGIYLLHMAVLKYIFAVTRYDPFKFGGVWSVIVIALVSLMISYGVTRIYSLIPVFIKRIKPEPEEAKKE